MLHDCIGVRHNQQHDHHNQMHSLKSGCSRHHRRDVRGGSRFALSRDCQGSGFGSLVLLMRHLNPAVFQTA